MRVAQALLEEHGADPLATTRRFDVALGFDKGGTPLHAAMFGCPQQHIDEMVALLLRNGADPNRRGGSGASPLLAAVGFHNAPGLQALMKHAKGTLRLEDGLKLNHASPLNCAAYASTPKMVEALLDAGANVLHVNDVRRRSAAPLLPARTRLSAVCLS